MSASTTGIKDVAARAGVSVGTVSNVLNRPERVSETDPSQGAAGDRRARLRPQRVRADSCAPGAAGRSPTSGSPSPTRSSPTWPGASRRSPASNGMAVFLCNSDGDPSREADYLEMLLEQRVRGVLVSPFDPADAAARAAAPARDRRWCSSSATAGAGLVQRRPSTTWTAARWRSPICSSRATGASPSSAARCTPAAWPTACSVPARRWPRPAATRTR